MAEPDPFKALTVTCDRLVRATIALYLALAAAFAVGFIVQRHQATEGQDAHTALCVLRTDLQQRVDSSNKFLHDHPHGIPGIPVSLIRNSIRNEQATLDSLRVLAC